MKQMKILLLLVLCGVLLGSQTVFANMAAPDDPDVGSSITFQKNDAIAVTSEVLDIEVHGSTADITAAYTMENTTDAAVSTPVMFLSPNVEEGGTAVTADGAALAFTVEEYALRYDTEIRTEEWRYAVLSEAEAEEVEQTVDAVSFSARRVLENAMLTPRETAEALASATRSEVGQVIGTKFVLYRQSHKKDKKDRIVLVKDKHRPSTKGGSLRKGECAR